MRRLGPVLALVVLVGSVQGLAGAPVQAQQLDIDTGASALEIAESIAADPSTVTGAAWVERPPSGDPTALATGFLGGFPRDGSDYGILTTGDADFADDGNNEPDIGVSNGGNPVRGDNDFDVTVLRVDVDVPSGANCLVGIEFRFLSDEYPEFVGSAFNDAFILELDGSTWTTAGSNVIAPDNFAFDPVGNVISINAAGVTSMTAAESVGTTYDGATPVLTAATPITPGAHSLYVSIFDQGDQIYDSAVFVDNLRFGTVADVANDCKPGAQVVDVQRPLPLLGAHGITGRAEDMQPNLDFADSAVDGIPETLSSDTAAVGSVWENAATLIVDARDVQERNNSGAVNVIAHSKGGLDSRVAMWAAPFWFEDLAMLATPNGGSGLADTLCVARRAGQNWLMADFGPCDTAADGLYNLQTGYIKDTYNAIVKDSPQHDFWIAAGDCMGFIFFQEGSISCNATSIVGHECTDIDGFLGLGDADGENAVCVWSAFAQVNGFDPGGSHFAIDPVFERRNHTDMRQDPCPNTAVLAWTYGPFYPDNPWIVGDGDGCEDLPRIDDTFEAVNAAFVPVPAAALQTEPETDFGPIEVQSIEEVVLGADGTASLPVTDEGLGFGVLAVAAPGDFSGFELTDTGGAVVPPTTAQATAIFETPGSFAAIFPTVGTGTLTVTGEPGASIGIGTSVVTEVSALAEATVVSDDEVELVVTLSGASPSVANDLDVTAFVGNGLHVDPVAIPLDQVNGQTLTFRATIPPERGSYQPVDVMIAGPHQRVLTTGFIMPDGTGSIDELVSDTLVDTDDDGVDDALALDIRVSTDDPGPHQLSLQLEADGVVVGNGPGSAELAAGVNTMTVIIGLDEMASVGLAGPYEVTDLVLTRGAAMTWVARADSLGHTSAVPLSELGAGELEVSRPAASAADNDLDGRLDELTWSWTTWVAEAGTYEFVAALLGPQGEQLDTLAFTEELLEGPNSSSYTFDGSVVGEHLAGRYVLVDLTATLETDEAVFDRAPAGISEYFDPAAWVEGTPDITTLTALWRMAYFEGQIFTNGFYQSELNRLGRAADAIADGDIAGAVRELETFVSHVDKRAGKKIDADTASQISGYANALIDALQE